MFCWRTAFHSKRAACCYLERFAAINCTLLGFAPVPIDLPKCCVYVRLLDVIMMRYADVMLHELTSAPRQVDLYENGTIAIVEAVSPELGNRVQRVRVQLPGTSQELLQRFRDKSVDFAAHSNTEDGGAVFLNLLGAHAQCMICGCSGVHAVEAL